MTFLIVSCVSACPSRSKHEDGIRNDKGILGTEPGKGTAFRL